MIAHQGKLTLLLKTLIDLQDVSGGNGKEGTEKLKEKAKECDGKCGSRTSLQSGLVRPLPLQSS